MKRLLPVIVIMGLVALFSNCNKTKNLPVVVLDNDTINTRNFDYKPGTYWIYVDTMSGRLDSFYVRTNGYTNQVSGSVIYQYHTVIIAEQNVNGVNAADSALWVWNFENSSIKLDYDYSYYGFQWRYDVSYSPLFTYPFTLGPMITENDTASVVGVLPIDTISGIPMSSVAVIHHFIAVDTTLGDPGTTINDWFYVNDTLGIVQMSLNHPAQSINRFWRLKRYKIKR